MYFNTHYVRELFAYATLNSNHILANDQFYINPHVNGGTANVFQYNMYDGNVPAKIFLFISFIGSTITAKSNTVNSFGYFCSSSGSQIGCSAG